MLHSNIILIFRSSLIAVGLKILYNIKSNNQTIFHFLRFDMLTISSLSSNCILYLFFCASLQTTLPTSPFYCFDFSRLCMITVSLILSRSQFYYPQLILNTFIPAFQNITARCVDDAAIALTAVSPCRCSKSINAPFIKS